MTSEGGGERVGWDKPINPPPMEVVAAVADKTRHFSSLCQFDLKTDGIMDGVQVSFACLLLKMTFDPGMAQPPKQPCPTCPEGYFMKKNCSDNKVRMEGIQCQQCTDCSAAHQDTLLRCSTFADSLCGNKTAAAVTSTATPTEPPVSEVWILLTVTVLSLVLVLIVSLFLILLSCRNHHRNKFIGLDPL